MMNHVSRARWTALMAATAVALYLCWLMLQPFVAVLEWAAVLAIVFYPVHRRLAARLNRPGLSALVSSLLVMAVILIPLSLVTLALANELAGAARYLPAHVSALLSPDSPATGKVVKWLGQYVDVEALSSQQFAADWLGNMTGAVARHSLGLVGGLAGLVVKTFFVIFTMYYLFRDGEKIVRALPGVLPLGREQSEALFERAGQVISASVYGVVVVAVIQGALGGLAFWTLGLPSPLLWALMLTFVCMIPVAGSFFVWLPASIYLAVSGHWTKAIILFLWGLLVISTMDNFLRPKLIRERTKLHELFVFFSVLGGLQVFGLLGIILGPVVLAITLALLDTFRQLSREGQHNSGDGHLALTGKLPSSAQVS